MMKRLLQLVTVIAVGIGMLVAMSGVSLAEQEGDYTYTVTDGKATITRYSGAGEVDIPSKLGGYPVIAIGDNAFSSLHDLTRVIIPQGVTSIGNKSFQACDILTSITIPSSVTSIGDGAFLYCSSLTNIMIPSGVAFIGKDAFTSCTRLVSIDVSEENSCFSTINGVLFDKTKIVLIKCPQGITGTFQIPESVETIGENSFFGCNKLIGLEIPNTVTTIGNQAFMNSGLKELSLPNGITLIPENAFFGCQELASIDLSDSLQRICFGAFSNCPKLFSLAIPEGVSIIERNAFSESGLVSLIIPGSIETFGMDVFSNCNQLTSVQFSSGIQAIPSSLFSGCKKLSDISIPESVKSIGAYAFYDCDALVSVMVPDSVTSIGMYAYAKCDNLVNVHLPSGTPYISMDMFLDCKKLANVAIPDTVTTIYEFAFYNCCSLIDLEIPDSVTSIGDRAFGGCYRLRNINLPSGILRIPSGLFEFCSSLTELDLPAGVTMIGSHAFSDSGIQSIVVPSSASYISSGAFYSCPDLETIVMNSNVQEIGCDTFSQCENLKSIYFYGPLPDFDPYAIRNSSIELKLYYHVSQSDSWEGYVTYPNQPFCDLVLDYEYNGLKTHAFASINGGRITAPTLPQRTGYIFAGWYKEPSCTIPWNFETDTVTEDITLYAKWSIQQFSVTFKPNGGSDIEPVTAAYGATITTPACEKIGCTLQSWFTDPEFSDIWDFSTCKVIQDTTLYAKWSINTYTVTFSSQGGTTVSPQTAEYNTTITAPTPPTRSGHTFSGWFKDPACTPPWNFESDTVTEDITLYAKWSVNQYTVTFVPNGGSSVEQVSAAYDTKITQPACEKIGCALQGWYTDPDFTDLWDYSTRKVEQNTTLYAKWSINTHTVTFSPQGGTVVSPKTAQYGTTITAPTPPTRPDYAFQGWYKEASCTNAWNFATNKVTTDITLYAKWASTTPAAVKAVSASYTSVKVTWNAVPSASGYQVYSATSSAGPWTLKSTVTALYFTNTGLVTGKTYYYKVRSYNAAKACSAYSSVVSARPIPATPYSVKAAAASYNSARISWAAVSGATRYEVYRATSSTGSYSLVGTTTAISFTNTGLRTGSPYYYKVRCYHLEGSTKVTSAYSAVVAVKTAIGAPGSVRAARASSTSIRVTWGRVTGATRYELWRSTSATGSYSLVSTTSSLYYTNTKLTTGRLYYYKVRAYHLEGSTKVYSAWSVVVSAKP